VYENNEGHCGNQYPNCPALVDAGQNFGHGFYNDHHFHFGYHIYAAAVAARFDADWGRKNHEHVLLLVRDIANPSPYDPYFPTWRHKDWCVDHISHITIMSTHVNLKDLNIITNFTRL
jgi:hypothetical protein